MTDQLSPICIKTLLQLTTSFMDEDRTPFLTMSSHKFICVCEKVGTPSQFVITDIENPTNPIRREFYTYYATMNPASKIIAYTWIFNTGDIKIFNLETESTMKCHTMAEKILFLKWINADKLALVTDTAVFHWCTKGESQPQKMFDRHSSLADYRIVNYRWDDKLQWLLLNGISYKMPPHGAMQLYSVERGVSLILEGQTAAFTQFKVEGNSVPSTLLCFAFRPPEENGKLHIKELGQPLSNHQPYTEKNLDVCFERYSKDIPLAVQTDSKHDILYLITQTGYIHLYHVETASLIYTSRFGVCNILVTVPHEATSGVIAVNVKGQVLSVGVDKVHFVPYIRNVLKKRDIALRTTVRNYLSEAEVLFVQKFITLCDQGQYTEAAKVALNATEAYSSIVCKLDAKGPVEEISGEEHLVDRNVPRSLFLSKEAGKVCTSELPVVPEENKVLKDLKELFFNKEDCDVVLEVKGQEFPAHKPILKVRSPVFAATFGDPWNEKVTGIVKIEDCDPSNFSDFLCFLYCGDGTLITEENVFSLFKTADKYDVKDLRSKCVNFMKENLSVDIFCDSLVIALQHYETELIQLATEFFNKNAASIVSTVKWQSFLTENPVHGTKLLIQLLR